MIAFKLSSFKEKEIAYDQLLSKLAEISDIESSLNSFAGFSYPANSFVDFAVHKDVDGCIQWRETLICPLTGLINRCRGAAHLFEVECNPSKDSTIYISESISPLYTYLKSKFSNLIGSEYLGKEIDPGEIVNGIQHEDLTNLSFEDNSLDYCLSFDCFEHMPNPLDAFKSCYSKLRKGGALVWTAPFSIHEEKNIQRARIDELGNTIHILPPEYHGDPLNKEGALSYHVFGWEMLDQLRDLGFRDVYAVLYWSRKFAYLGGLHSAFFAFK